MKKNNDWYKNGTEVVQNPSFHFYTDKCGIN